MPRLAFLQFYPNDWLAEPSIRSCSLAARGLWIDMLSLMHLSPRRGYLLAVNGKPHTHEQIARLTGCSSDDVSLLLAELQSSGCFSCTSDGTIYSRRMVRDEEIRQVRSDAGRKGGEISGKSRVCLSKNPSKGEANHQAKSKLPETRVQKPEDTPPHPPPGGAEDFPTIPAEIDSPEFRSAWSDWIADRKRRKNAVTPLAAKRQFAALVPLGPTGATECVLESLRNGWTGVFPERVKGDSHGRKDGTGDVGRIGRISAPPGKYDHLEGHPGVALTSGPGKPELFGPADDET